MSKITFPPLPAPDIWVREDFGLGDSTVHQGYTAEQMQERDRQIAALVRAQVLEEAIDTVELFGGSVEIEAALRGMKSDSGHPAAADAGASTAPLPEGERA